MNTPAERIAALRARGAERLDPLRFHFIEALARRTAATGGPARPQHAPRPPARWPSSSTTSRGKTAAASAPQWPTAPSPRRTS